MVKLRLYHGTREDFSGPPKVNLPPYEGSIGRGIYFATTPNTAAYYGPKVHEVDVDLKNPLVIDACQDGSEVNYRLAPEAQEGRYDSILVGENIPPFDVLIGGQWHEIRDGDDLEDIGALAKEAGHDAVLLNNARVGSSANNEVLILDPSVITQYHGQKKVDPAWDRKTTWDRQFGEVQWEKQAQANPPTLTNWYQERDQKKASYKAKLQEAARLPVAPFNDYLFHGTPLDGLLDMIRDGISPNDHSELNIPALSTSINSEVLVMFSDGEKQTGLIFNAHFNKVVTLDDTHYCLAAYEAGDFIDDLMEKNPGLEARLRQIGYVQHDGSVGMSEGELAGLFPDADAFILPGFDNPHVRAEAEMAVTELGCKKLEHMIEYIYIRDHEFDTAEGLTKLKEMAKLVDSGRTVDQAFQIVVEKKESPSLPDPQQTTMKLAQIEAPDFESALKEIDAGEKYDDKEGVHYLGEGAERCETGVCTNTAKWLAKRLGGEVRGYRTEAGSGKIGEDCFGHDFCLVQNRWIVDWWANRLLEHPAVWDLQDPQQQAQIKKLYGSPTEWEPLTPVVKTAAKIDYRKAFIRQQTRLRTAQAKSIEIRSVCNFCKRVINPDNTPGELAGANRIEDSHGCCNVCRQTILDNVQKGRPLTNSTRTAAVREPSNNQILVREPKVPITAQAQTDLQLYHGRRPSGTAWDKDGPIYLTPDQETAEHYARVTDSGHVGDESGGVFSVKAKIHNPLDLRPLGIETSCEELNRLLSKAGVPYEFRCYEHLKGLNPTWLYFSKVNPEAAQMFFQAIKNSGHDGIVLFDNSSRYGKDPSGLTYIALSRDQITENMKTEKTASWYAQAKNSLVRYSAKKKSICVDLDETIAAHAKYPKIGKPMPGVKKALRELREAGYTIRIYTCRLNGSHKKDEHLREFKRIEKWLEENRIPYDDLVEKEGKPFCDYFIDDKNIEFTM